MRRNDKYNEAVAANLAPSRRARRFVVIAALGTVAMVAAADLPPALRILGFTWVACVALHAWGRAGARRQLHLDADGSAVVDGIEGAVRPGSFVAPGLTVLRWRRPGAACDRAVLILPDMLPPEPFRRLRVILNTGDRAATGHRVSPNLGERRSGN